LASTATVRPPIQVRMNDPHPDRGWAGVPANHLATLTAALGQSHLNRPAAVPGDSESSDSGFFRPSKPFAVPQPLNIPSRTHLVGNMQRHVSLLGDQPFSARMAKAMHSGNASRQETASAGPRPMPLSLGEKSAPSSGQRLGPSNGTSDQLVHRPTETAPHNEGDKAPETRREDPSSKRSRLVDEHRSNLANADVHNGSQSPTHGHATVHQNSHQQRGSRAPGTAMQRSTSPARSLSRVSEPRTNRPPALVHAPPPHPAFHPKPLPHH
jgi:hypothetical protein